MNEDSTKDIGASWNLLQSGRRAPAIDRAILVGHSRVDVGGDSC